MIEVHEPARLLIVVEQTCAILEKTIAKIGNLKEWIDNDWVRFVSCHPDSRELFLYTAKGWEAVEFPEIDSVPHSTHSEKIIVGKTETIPVHHFIRRSA